MRKLVFGVLAVVALTALAGSWAAQSKPSKPVDPILQQIESKDPAQIQEAVTTVWEQLHAETSHDRRVAVLGRIKKGHWLTGLMAAQRYEDVAGLALEGTLALPWDIPSVEYMQTYRVQALLKMSKPEEALAAAKGFFNVCTMKDTANALVLVIECLKAAHPGDEAIIDRLREEQMAGAVVGTDEEREAKSVERGEKASGGSSKRSVLASIKVNGSLYDKAMQEYTGEDYGSLAALGNLLLLADKPKEARPLFERAYAIAAPKHLAAATESIARCMRAEDGTVGRANAWVLSIRP